MKGLAFVRTNFGGRQNDRHIVLISVGRSGGKSSWLPKVKRKRLPYLPPLQRHEVTSSMWRFGTFNGLHETGEPKFTREIAW